jgi:hypothetical protein
MGKLLSFFTVFFIVAIVVVSAQTRRPIKRSSEIRLSSDKPSVYISYVRSGKREPLRADENDEGVWLRLHNNTKWTIIFPAFDVPETHGQVGMFYVLEPVSADITDLPKGNEIRHVYSTEELGPGESVLFSVPREHLPKGVVLRVRFSYEWEDQADVFVGREVEHIVSFYASKLPQLK